jgi:hypothetical protein
MALHFASQPTFGLGLIKQAINAAETNTLDAQLDLERDYQRLAGRSDDYREGVSAFLAKRAPNFTGNKMLNIRTVAVIGSGTMGAGIAEVAASHGHQVLIYDIAASRHFARHRRYPPASGLPRDARKTVCGCRRADPRAAASGHDIALAAADLVIEAASERLEVKKRCLLSWPRSARRRRC